MNSTTKFVERNGSGIEPMIFFLWSRSGSHLTSNSVLKIARNANLFFYFWPALDHCTTQCNRHFHVNTDICACFPSLVWIFTHHIVGSRRVALIHSGTVLLAWTVLYAKTTYVLKMGNLRTAMHSKTKSIFASRIFCNNRVKLYMLLQQFGRKFMQ